MSKTYRIAVLGLTHDHVWSNLEELRQTGRAELVAAADPNPPLQDRVKQAFGCATYADADTLLTREKLDAVYIFADNALSTRLIEKAAQHRLHALVEKPLAANLQDADRALAAVRTAGVRLMINWPFAWWPQMQKALEMATTGALGELWQVKYRAAHAGPREIGCSPFFYEWLYDAERNGAGALMDYCCYGAALAACLLGMPSRVVGVAGRLCKEDILVEDNAVLVLSYPRAQAITEGSWTQVGDMTSYIATFYGSKGTLLITPGGSGTLTLATKEKPDGVPVEVGPAAEKNASEHFLRCLETEKPFLPLCSDRIGRDAQEILEAGLISVARGAAVSLPLLLRHA